MMTLGEKVRVLRKERRLRQRQLAEDIGVHANDVGRWERGQITPSVEAVIKLARYFGVTADYLLFDGAPRNGRVEVQDPGLLEQFQKADRLDNEERRAIKLVVEGMVVRHEVQHALASAPAQDGG